MSYEFEATFLRATLLLGIERRSIPSNNVARNIKEKPPLPRLRRTRAMAAVWTTAKVVSLIALYEERPCLYETTSKEYFNRDLRNKALQEIVESLGEFSGK